MAVNLLQPATEWLSAALVDSLSLCLAHGGYAAATAWSKDDKQMTIKHWG